MPKPILWLEVPEAHDYPAAASYLSLLYGEAAVAEIVLKLQGAHVSRFKAKDIIRASGLMSLGTDNAHVAKNLNKIAGGKRLSPLLLIRGEPLLIADGYHRACAVYLYDEDAEIPCQII